MPERPILEASGCFLKQLSISVALQCPSPHTSEKSRMVASSDATTDSKRRDIIVGKFQSVFTSYFETDSIYSARTGILNVHWFILKRNRCTRVVVNGGVISKIGTQSVNLHAW